MPLAVKLKIGEGVRIGQTDVWLLHAVAENPAAAEFVDPTGQHVSLQEWPCHQVGPGLKLSIKPAQAPDEIILIVDAYVPLVQRHPPRAQQTNQDNKQGYTQ